MLLTPVQPRYLGNLRRSGHKYKDKSERTPTRHHHFQFQNVGVLKTLQCRAGYREDRNCNWLFRSELSNVAKIWVQEYRCSRCNKIQHGIILYQCQMTRHTVRHVWWVWPRNSIYRVPAVVIASYNIVISFLQFIALSYHLVTHLKFILSVISLLNPKKHKKKLTFISLRRHVVRSIRHSQASETKQNFDYIQWKCRVHDFIRREDPTLESLSATPEGKEGLISLKTRIEKTKSVIVPSLNDDFIPRLELSLKTTKSPWMTCTMKESVCWLSQAPNKLTNSKISWKILELGEKSLDSCVSDLMEIDELCIR